MKRVPVGKNIYTEGLAYLNSDVRGTSIRDVFKPQAINYNGNIYFTWEDYNGDIYVTKFKSGAAFGVGILIATRNIDYNNINSDIEHSVPTICIDNSGYIYVFYGCHNTQMYYRKSTNPEDVSLWSARLSVTGATIAAYPQPFMHNGSLCVAYRSGTTTAATQKSLSFIKSPDGGATWGSPLIVFTPTAGVNDYWTYVDGIVIGSESPTPSIHALISLRDNITSAFTSPMHLKSLDGGVTWGNSAGTTHATPLTQSNLIVIDSVGYPGDIKINSTGIPYVCFTNGNTNQTIFAKWNGSAWVETVVAAVSTSYYEHCELDLIDDNTIDIYLISGTASTLSGGDIKRYRSTNAGTSFSLAENITSDATSLLRYFFPKIVKNHDSLTRIIYMQAYPQSGYTFINKQFLFKTA